MRFTTVNQYIENTSVAFPIDEEETLEDFETRVNSLIMDGWVLNQIIITPILFDGSTSRFLYTATLQING